ncbi:MAG TPA: hypothetical protein VJG90_08770 [Candidatus Nanoarchaeia archaeon]|nr:hypothetical protein [Candidatus Nanoarchaeia archaeon]
MVKLFGVNHGGRQQEVDGSTWEVYVRPSSELLSELSQLPKGARVGIEWLSRQDWDRVHEHVETLIVERGLIEKFRAGYDSSLDYWDWMERFCLDQGLSVVYLEEVECYLNYNRVKIIELQHTARLQEMCPKRGERDLDFMVRVSAARDAEYRAKIRARKVHEIERENALLRVIEESDLTAALVGLVHSDYWWTNAQKLQAENGILFDRYSADEVPMLTGKHRRVQSLFQPNRTPDRINVFGREGLRRALRLLSEGDVTGQKPNFVGTWDPTNPSRGYFEVFVENEIELEGRPHILGRIEDCLGSASFAGHWLSNGIQFTKEYRDCSEEAASSQLVYRGTACGDEWVGFFEGSGTRRPFYMVKADRMKPLRMTQRWCTLQQEVKNGLS